MADSYYIELIGKTIQVLEVLRDGPKGLSLREIVDRTGFVKSSLHRILQSLKRHGYVDQDSAGGAYRLGLQVLTLPRGVNGGGGLPQFARPYLTELAEAFDESAYLALVRSGKGIFVEVQETRRDLRLVGPLGAEVSFHATAAGKAIAAFLPAADREKLLARITLAPLTERTIVRRDQLQREWAKARVRGYAVNNGETIVGAIFLAAAVLDANGLVCSAISVGVPQARYSTELGHRIANRLMDSCQRLSEKLAAAGYGHPNVF